MQADLFEFGRPKVPETVEIRKTGVPSSFFEQKTFVLRLDHALMGAIAIVVSGVLLYGAGVECGRRFALKPLHLAPAAGAVQAPAVEPSAIVSIQKPLSPETASLRTSSGELSVSSSSSSYSETKTEITRVSANRPKSGFMIQLATYKAQSIAQRRVQELNARGIESFVMSSGAYYLVCANGFLDRKIASKRLMELKTKGVAPKDAYVRGIPA